MARRSTPERLYQARRDGIRNRLIGDGELPDGAEALVSAWEAATAEQGVKRDWSPAWDWIDQKRRRQAPDLS